MSEERKKDVPVCAMNMGVAQRMLPRAILHQKSQSGVALLHYSAVVILYQCIYCFTTLLVLLNFSLLWFSLNYPLSSQSNPTTIFE